MADPSRQAPASTKPTGARAQADGAVPLRTGCQLWDIAGEYRTFLIIPSALVMQVMHPMVGAAVRDHSVFHTDPWGRAVRTANSMLRFIYGGYLAPAEAQRLRELHRPIRGIDEQGRSYHALNGAAYAWVHCSTFERYVTARRLFGRPLDRVQEKTLYQDMLQLGRVLQVPEREMPPTVGDFWDYLADMVAGQLENNAATRLLLTDMRHPAPPPFLPSELDYAWRRLRGPLGRAANLLTIGTLPPEIREILGGGWSNAEQHALSLVAAATRAVFALLPERARYTPAVAHIRRREKARQRR
jgi:uncharacterized protein (DUF2236 family)